MKCEDCGFVLTAGLSGAVDGVHPQVGRAGVKQHLEGLRRSSNADGSVVGGLGNTVVGGAKSEKQGKKACSNQQPAIVILLQMDYLTCFSS